ncbi:chloride channel protein [Phaeacidiphilus oryzae]|uniref:chloride channel protein n=1 Tax=Phaeacidiphilus oryzae TaxID=348818 RepID=UPI000562DF5D|nr:chloride channel protein [Phaeacidiphilus oryzae]
MAAGAGPEIELRGVLLSPGYLRLLLLSGVLGVPIALACFFFVGLQNWLSRQVWQQLPLAVGFHQAPWWWPLPALALAGLILVPIVTRMPGGGGHAPVFGLGGGEPIGPRELPGVVLAALTTLPLGVCLGPESPLMGLGSGLALLALGRMRALTGQGGDPRAGAILAGAGSTAAISTILGGPLVAAVLVVESAGLAGGRLTALLLPALLASATGALVFTGFGHWTGLSIGALSLPHVPPDTTPDAGDFLWGVLIAALVAAVVTGARSLGLRTHDWTGRRTAPRTLACALAVGACLAVFGLLTGRPPGQAALSGEETLVELAADPHAWSLAALVALVLCKGLAWGISLGALRGGPIFPAVLVGAAVGVACAGLPGLGVTPALAVGMTAAAAVLTGLPFSSTVLSVLLLGPDAHNQMPLIVVAAVVAFGVGQLLTRPVGEDARGPNHSAG